MIINEKWTTDFEIITCRNIKNRIVVVSKRKGKALLKNLPIPYL
jgi:hypothetical protein